MIKADNLILGAGIAGLGAGLKLQEERQDYLILLTNPDRMQWKPEVIFIMLIRIWRNRSET